MNIEEMVKYNGNLIFKVNKICEILHDDGYYPTEQIYETAIAIASEVFQDA